MQGHINGVKTQIQAEQPAAISVHCLAHCINLCLQDLCQACNIMRDALDLAIGIIHLIRFSPKRSNLFKELQVDDVVTLKALSKTQWTVRTRSFNSILLNYSTLLETLEEVNLTTHDEYGTLAGGYLDQMGKFATLFGLKCF